MNVIIPWRGGCPHRERALAWVLEQWAGLGLTPRLGTTDGPWSKAAAINAALPDDGPLVIADADVFPADPNAITEAVEALSDNGWAIPHGNVCRLTLEATDALISGADLPLKRHAEQPYLGWEGGGMTVLHRDTWDAAPMDPRFVGWGQEDESWARALHTLVGPPWRGTTDLIHLWHPAPERENRRVGSKAGAMLARRYGQAHGNPEAMRALIGEAA